MCVVCITIASAFVAAVSLVVVSCDKKKDRKTDVTLSAIEAHPPIWVSNPYETVSPGFVASVGFGEKLSNNDELKFLIAKAESKAKIGIQKTVETELLQVVQTLDVSDSKKRDFEKIAHDMVKNIPVSNAMRDKMHQDKSGNLYVRVTMSEATIKRYLQDYLTNYEEMGDKALFIQLIEKFDFQASKIQAPNAAID